MADRVILWDFDGTLGHRPGMWGGCLIEVLDEHHPDHGLTRELVAPHLRGGFPWHDHDQPHEHLNEPDAYWDHLTGVLDTALRRAGLETTAAARFREHYVRPDAWVVYDDSVAALDLARSAGWNNVIVSNHVPELPELLDGLGLGTYVSAVVTSAVVGYEKPHREIFTHALAVAGHPSQCWMVGDNPIADIAGAAALGIPGVLTRSPELTAARVRHVEAGYGRPHLAGWVERCRVTAPDALAAVRHILRG